MSLQVFLVEQRVRAGLQRSDVAKLIGISPNAVKHWETPESRTIIKPAYILKVAEIYKISPLEILKKAKEDWEQSETRPIASVWDMPSRAKKGEKYKQVVKRLTGSSVFKDNDCRYMVTCCFCSKPMPIRGAKRMGRSGSFFHPHCKESQA